MILRKCLRDPPDQRITDQDHGSKDQDQRITGVLPDQHTGTLCDKHRNQIVWLRK